MINIAICDDDKAVCSQIEHILLEYASKNCLKIDVEVFFTGESILNFLNQGNSLDLIYLDIEMEGLSGIEVGKQIRTVFKNYTMEIVYISGSDGYDRQLFDVQPLHFIPKPINSTIIINDLKLAIDRTQKLRGFFEYQKGHDAYKIPIHEILYFESLNREIKIVTASSEYTFYSNFKNVILAVSQFNFLQIHRSYLINYHHATVLRYSEIVMSNGTVLPISRSKQQKLRNLQLEEN